MKHIVIPICGFARSGKDTLSDAIFEQLEEVEPTFSCMVCKFADQLKIDVQEALNRSGVRFDVFTEDDEKKKAIRPLLVAYGEFCRILQEDVWVCKVDKVIKEWVVNSVEKSASSGSVILIPDMRYLNEYRKVEALCKANGWEFVPIYIEREGNNPANDAEAVSIAKMAAAGCFSSGNALQLSFKSGCTDQIRSWARKFCQSMSVYQ